MKNTGTDCTPLINVTKKIMLMPVCDSTGTRNFINLTGTINAALFTAMINDTDNSQRLYPLPELKDVNDTRNDPVLQTFADDSTIFIRDGIRNFEGRIVGKNASPALKGKIESARCGEMGVFLVDRLGNLIGIVSDDKTKMYPIRLDSESIAAMFVNATDTTIQAIRLMFNFHPDEQDSCIGMITATELTDAKPLLMKGLLDVYSTVSGISTTGATVELYTDYGSAITPVRVKGLVTADFVSSVGGATSKVRNSTDAADIAVTVTEGTGDNAGIYTLAWVAQTVSDVIIVKPLKNGFDFTEVTDSTITIV
jgi:hypothetical protein